MTRILVPLDGSVSAERAIPIAKRMADLMRGEAVLVCVHDPRWHHGSGSDETLSDYLQRQCEAMGPVARYRLADDSTVVKGLLRIVAEEDIDLVVMSSHGRTAARELALGSVARDLLRSSPVPVMLVGLAASARNG